MLNLPISTKLSKPLPKKAIFAKFKMKTAEKVKFEADISRIVIVNEVSSTTTTIAKGDIIESFFVLHVTLKRATFDEKNIALLSKLIKQKMLFVLTYNNDAKLAVYNTKLLQSDWKPLEECSLELHGLNLDRVWEHIVIQVGNIQMKQGNTLDKQLLLDEERIKLQKKIDALERQARTEKQPKRKFELVQEMKKLERNKENKENIWKN